MKVLLPALLAALVGCGGDLDPPWQLDHDRIAAIRVTPPALQPGETGVIDGLVSMVGGTTLEGPPEAVQVASPQSLASAVTFEAGAWKVTAPDEAALAAARTELGLAAGAPVPLQLGVVYGGGTLVGLKSVRLGVTAQNPTLPEPTMDGMAMPPAGSEIVIAPNVDVVFRVEVSDDLEVNWLTSVGTMRDFDLPQSSIKVEPEDPTEGELAITLRDEQGGVDWRVWKLRAE